VAVIDNVVIASFYQIAKAGAPFSRNRRSDPDLSLYSRARRDILPQPKKRL